MNHEDIVKSAKAVALLHNAYKLVQQAAALNSHFAIAHIEMLLIETADDIAGAPDSFRNIQIIDDVLSKYVKGDLP